MVSRWLQLDLDGCNQGSDNGFRSACHDFVPYVSKPIGYCHLVIVKPTVGTTILMPRYSDMTFQFRK